LQVQRTLDFPSERGPILRSTRAPRWIALIGASEKRSSVGHALLENSQSFPAACFPINITMKAVSEQVGFTLRFDRKANEWLTEIKL
jgi:hypothetical protein